jgi:hypothetical protein
MKATGDGVDKVGTGDFLPGTSKDRIERCEKM